MTIISDELTASKVNTNVICSDRLEKAQKKKQTLDKTILYPNVFKNDILLLLNYMAFCSHDWLLNAL